MTKFIGTWIHQIDAKGRVSVPASFRTVVQAAGRNDVALYPSPFEAYVNGCGFDRIDSLANSIKDQLHPTAEEDDESLSLFGEIYGATFDGDGRIVLKDEFIQHANLSSHAAFVGVGHRFQIWQPEALQAARTQMRLRLVAKRKQPSQGDGGGQT